MKRMVQETFDINNMAGHQFESLIEELVKKMGFSIAERKLSADGGIDILAYSHDMLFEGKYVIQCKRYIHKVPEPPVRDLYGVVHSINANKGILITNSTFTKAATEFAKDKQLELIDGIKLTALLAKYNLVKNSQIVKFSASTTFLKYNFVPTLKQVRKKYSDMKNGTVYIEKRTISSEKEICTFLNKIIDRSRSFYTWWAETFARDFIDALKEKPFNHSRANAISQQIIKAILKFLKVYESFLAVKPGLLYRRLYSSCNEFLDKIFSNVFKIIDEVEALDKLSFQQMKERITQDRSININIDAWFPRDLLNVVKMEWLKVSILPNINVLDA